ncbi:type III secretion system export apparatus subunit SctS [Burkholderia pseudomallei]|uniref:type III secretion system export apparatus subunit SctS n=1 Tax=Burkholderia pseudomallei TaxID=28450 RepID=UPI00018A54EE|nr:type III secretion system export apparatus subunit SctS [Burkholderia pseudomallei]AIO99638.1 type III secretion, HrpO family protein [Burkholderia pseudomallei 576]AJX69362.1 type III secretion, HrpO family protein [Burkholderia pseudomallei MSHR840]EEC34817.1 type III secretion protein, HrpO family [Burkholderia pseudomallei 576]KGD31939.1 type III secretion, HrpO family protein [Burkholderia pseudomallei]OMR23529.1 EscS/YscS/HrcS family type III secretion system export apparatus protein 
MEIDDLIRLTSQGMMLCLYISLPVVLVAAASGLAISFLQAITSLQEQSISYGVKLVAVTVIVAIAGPWAAAEILHFAQQLMSAAVPS